MNRSALAIMISATFCAQIAYSATCQIGDDSYRDTINSNNEIESDLEFTSEDKYVNHISKDGTVNIGSEFENERVTIRANSTDDFLRLNNVSDSLLIGTEADSLFELRAVEATDFIFIPLLAVTAYQEWSELFSSENETLTQRIWLAVDTAIDTTAFGTALIPFVGEVMGALSMLVHSAESIHAAVSRGNAVVDLNKKMNVRNENLNKLINEQKGKKLSDLAKTLDSKIITEYDKLNDLVEKDIETYSKSLILSYNSEGKKVAGLYNFKIKNLISTYNKYNNQLIANFAQKASLRTSTNSVNSLKRAISIYSKTKKGAKELEEIAYSISVANESIKSAVLQSSKNLAKIDAKLKAERLLALESIANLTIKNSYKTVFDDVKFRSLDYVKAWYIKTVGDSGKRLTLCEKSSFGQYVCIDDNGFKINVDTIDKLPELKKIWSGYDGKRDFKYLLNNKALVIDKDEVKLFEGVVDYFYPADIAKPSDINGESYNEGDKLVFVDSNLSLDEKYLSYEDDRFAPWTDSKAIELSLIDYISSLESNNNVNDENQANYGLEPASHFINLLEQRFNLYDFMKKNPVNVNGVEYQYKGTYKGISIITGNRSVSSEDNSTNCSELNKTNFGLLNSEFVSPSIKDMEHISTDGDGQYFDDMKSRFNDDIYYMTSAKHGSTAYSSYNPKINLSSVHGNGKGNPSICLSKNVELNIKDGFTDSHAGGDNVTGTGTEVGTDSGDNNHVDSSEVIVMKREDGREFTLNKMMSGQVMKLTSALDTFHSELISSEDGVYRGLYSTKDGSGKKCSIPRIVNGVSTKVWGDILFKEYGNDNYKMIKVPCGDYSLEKSSTGRLNADDASDLYGSSIIPGRISKIDAGEKGTYVLNLQDYNNDNVFGYVIKNGLKNKVSGTYKSISNSATLLELNIAGSSSSSSSSSTGSNTAGTAIVPSCPVKNIHGTNKTSYSKQKIISSGSNFVGVDVNCDNTYDHSNIDIDEYRLRANIFKSGANKTELNKLFSNHISDLSSDDKFSQGFNSMKIRWANPDYTYQLLYFISGNKFYGRAGVTRIEGTINNGILEGKWVDDTTYSSCDTRSGVSKIDGSDTITSKHWGGLKYSFDEDSAIGTYYACDNPKNVGSSDFFNTRIFNKTDSNQYETLEIDLLNKRYSGHLKNDGWSQYLLEPEQKSTGTFDKKTIFMRRTGDKLEGFSEGSKIFHATIEDDDEMIGYLVSSPDHTKSCSSIYSETGISSNQWAKIKGFYDEDLLLFDYAVCNEGMPTHEMIMINKAKNKVLISDKLDAFKPLLRQSKFGRDPDARWVIKSVIADAALEWDSNQSAENCNLYTDYDDCGVPENSKNAKFDPNSTGDFVTIKSAKYLNRTISAMNEWIVSRSWITNVEPYWSDKTFWVDVSDQFFIFSDSGNCELKMANAHIYYEVDSGSLYGSGAADNIKLSGNGSGDNEGNLFFACGNDQFVGKYSGGSTSELTDIFLAHEFPVSFTPSGVDRWIIRTPSIRGQRAGMQISSGKIHGDERQAKIDWDAYDYMVLKHEFADDVVSVYNSGDLLDYDDPDLAPLPPIAPGIPFPVIPGRPVIPGIPGMPGGPGM